MLVVVNFQSVWVTFLCSLMLLMVFETQVFGLTNDKKINQIQYFILSYLQKKNSFKNCVLFAVLWISFIFSNRLIWRESSSFFRNWTYVSWIKVFCNEYFFMNLLMMPFWLWYIIKNIPIRIILQNAFHRRTFFQPQMELSCEGTSLPSRSRILIMK